MRCIALAAVVGWSSVALAQVPPPESLARYQDQGPAPAAGPAALLQSGDALPNGTTSGAVQAILPDPRDANRLYIGTPNGGIWSTTNGGQTWTPLSDRQSSLSIASLSFDPTDRTYRTIIAGVGLTSNGNLGQTLDDRGGLRTGLLYSQNGGTTWSEFGGSLVDKSVVGATARGDVFLVATAEPHDPAAVAGYGLYRSDTRGTAFQLWSGSHGLPAGAVSSLAGDVTDPSLFYAAVNSSDPTLRRIYRSVNTAGQDWSPLNGLTVGINQIARLATGPNGSVAVALYDLRAKSDDVPNGRTLVGLYLSRDRGDTWTALRVPAVNAGSNQAPINLAVAIDRTNPNIVYVAGDGVPDSTPGPFRAPVYRVVLRSDGTSFPEALTDGASGSFVHADARAIAFDANGRLLLAQDGGVYARTDPQGSSGDWTGLNSSSLSIREPYAVAYDAVSKRLVVAAQDTGTAYQNAPASRSFDVLEGADGTNATVKDTDRNGGLLTQGTIYLSYQNLSSLRRIVVDSQGRQQTNRLIFAGRPSFDPDHPEEDHRLLNFQDDDFRAADSNNLPFGSRIMFNRNPGNRQVVLGTNHVYFTTDDLLQNAPVVNGVRQALTDLGGVNGSVTALDYGTANNPDAVLAGSNGNDQFRLYLSTDNNVGLQRLRQYRGAEPSSVVFDRRSSQRFFVADTTDLWSTTNSGGQFTSLTQRLTDLNIQRPTAVEFISSNGVNSLLAGGLVSDRNAPSPIAAVDSDGNGNLLDATWRAFGRGLPNTIVGQLAYNPTADTLAVGLYGRGVWLLYDVTSYFSTATALVFGLANNDSTPDASLLSGARNLLKAGTGTLTIGGDTSYTGSTTVRGGTLVANASLASSAGGLTIEGAGTVRGTGTLPRTTVDGTLWPGNSIGTITVNGNLFFNVGSRYQVEVSPSLGSRTNVINGGVATLGGNLSVIAYPGGYAPSRTFVVLNAPGGIVGAFEGATSNYAFLQPALSRDTNNIFLTLTPGGFARGGQTPNQTAVGTALDRSVASASGDWANVVSALALMTSGQAPAVFEQLSGQNYSGFSTSAVQTAQLFMTNFAQQAGGGQTAGGGRIALAEACDVACDATAPPRWGAWGGALGGVGTVAGDASGHGVSFNIGGFAAGLDRRFDPSFLAGVTVGYASSTQYTQGMDGRGVANTMQAGLYGTYDPGSLYVSGLAGYAHSDNQMIRPIAVPGLGPRTAIGQTYVDQFFGQLEGGYRIGLGGPADAFVTPFARLQGSTATQAGFTETGANSLNLSVAPQTTNSLRSVFGGRLGAGFDMGWREKLALTLQLGWSHEYADTSRPVNASFAGAPASPFTVAGATAPRDGAVVGLAANTAIAEATSVYLRYDGEVAGGNTSHILSGGVRITW